MSISKATRLVVSIAVFGALAFIAIQKVAAKKTPKEEVVVHTLPPLKKEPFPATELVQLPKFQAQDQREEGNSSAEFPSVDRMKELFSVTGYKLPIVETITYKSRVDWLKGRPAWIADYASHYATSRHFIARSLNGNLDYFTQKVSPLSRFNVFRLDKDIQFYLLVDVSLCKMALYYFDVGTKERVLLKTYTVGLGRKDPRSPSGCLTPMGTYSLGSKIAIYKPGILGYFLDQQVEMIRVFGTRWIPFEQEFGECTAPAKGYGIHGAPFQEDRGELVENLSCLGMYEGDGCVRLSSKDIEEIFSIVITRPAFLVIVNDFRQAKLPGMEVSIPSR